MFFLRKIAEKGIILARGKFKLFSGNKQYFRKKKIKGKSTIKKL